VSRVDANDQETTENETEKKNKKPELLYHRLSGLDDRNLSHSPSYWKCEVQVLTRLVMGSVCVCVCVGG